MHVQSSDIYATIFVLYKKQKVTDELVWNAPQKKAKRALIQEFILVISVLLSMTDFKILNYQDANM